MMRELHAEVGTATPERFDVILPAGGRISGEFAEKAGTTVKTLITFEGQTILHRTLVALRKTGRAGRIVVIGPPEVLAEAQRMGVEGLLPEGDSGPENILRGLRWLSEARELERVALEMASTVIQEEGGGFRVLIVTTDLPFLTAGALERFLDACPPDAELAVPVVTQEAFDARYPNSGSTYTPLKDGSFTIGGAFVADGATVLRNEAHLHAVFAARKSPWKMARLIGFSTILRYLTRQLTVAQLVEHVGNIARCRGVAVPQMPPELAYDIDELYEFDYARAQEPSLHR